MENLRKEFDKVFDEWSAKQGFLTRRGMEAKRAEIWSVFVTLVSPYYADAICYRNLPLSAKDKE